MCTTQELMFGWNTARNGWFFTGYFNHYGNIPHLIPMLWVRNNLFEKRSAAEQCNMTCSDLLNTTQSVKINAFRKSFASLKLSSLTVKPILLILRLIWLDLMAGKGKILSEAHAWGRNSVIRAQVNRSALRDSRLSLPDPLRDQGLQATWSLAVISVHFPDLNADTRSRSVSFSTWT